MSSDNDHTAGKSWWAFTLADGTYLRLQGHTAREAFRDGYELVRAAAGGQHVSFGEVTARRLSDVPPR